MNVLDDFGAVCPALGNNAIINVGTILLKQRDSVHVTKLEYMNILRTYYSSYYRASCVIAVAYIDYMFYESN